MAQVEYLVVGGGGGGGGGFQGGGGGAGGFLTATGLTVTAKNYTITVGLGGKGCRNGDSTAALNGGNSEILDGVTTLVSSIGGGRGGSEAPDATASTGGSGGGGNRASGASGTLGQGNAGGNGAIVNQWPCGGGGGASGVGGNGSSPTTRGTGGPGTSSSISGASVTYSTGGLGGWRPFNNGEDFTGASGGNNTGDGGGGGGGRNLSANPAGVGGNGGSGVVIIRYTTDGSDGVDATLTTGGTKTTSGIYTIHTFTTGGTFSVVTVTVTTTSNVIKSATTVSIGTLKKNDFLIGVSTSVDYGPTVTTGFWNGISPPSNGYTVYAQKSSQGPSIRLASNDSELITIATQYGGTGINTIYDALNYFNDNSTYMVTNINYPDIVTSGLTAMWDGGFVPSYPRTGTTWSDLSGNEYDLALLGGPVYSGTNGGGVYFDGVNDTAQSTSITLSYPQGYSLSMWFEISSIETNGGLFSFNGSNFINLTFTTSSFGWETGLSERLDWNVAPVVGQIYNITCTYNPNTSTSIIYENGTQVAINTSSTVQHTSQTAQLKLDNSPSLNLFNGAIYNCFFYTNKVLSPAEVTQNYNALKGRFGL